ncbi:MAG: L-idonate 5-dehydrogenase [Methylobacteriaceae bacterium]|nr:L-idonate 5-dehydrogenase [Methylobacteriaceae bacterium]
MALAAVIHAPHDLRIDEVPDAAPRSGEALVRIAAGGICGSDLHYYHRGGFGAVRIKEPMVLGHEVAGTIEQLGEAVGDLAVGQRVAINPSRPCNRCEYCLAGLQNHCLDMRFYGSAMRFPHVQGAFRQMLVCDAAQLVPVPDRVSAGEAACAEPLAVCLHAVRRAGDLLGKRLLIIGAGPIGTLILLAARRAGAGEVVVTDIVDAPLALAGRMGADATINTASEPDGLSPFERNKGAFDVLFEASGSAKALNSTLAALRPRAVIVQVGLGGEALLPMNTIVAKEFDLRGAFRFHAEFATAVGFIAARLIDVRPLITQTVPLSEAVRGFELAGDRTRAMKVQLSFE